MKYKDIVQQTGIKLATCAAIKRRREKLIKFLNTRKIEDTTRRKRFRAVSHPDVEQVVKLWLIEQYNANVFVTNKMIKSKAESCHAEICEKSRCAFNGNYNWVSRFKKRHGFSSETTDDKPSSGLNEENINYLPNLNDNLMSDYENLSEGEIFQQDEFHVGEVLKPQKYDPLLFDKQALESLDYLINYYSDNPEDQTYLKNLRSEIETKILNEFNGGATLESEIKIE